MVLWAGVTFCLCVLAVLWCVSVVAGRADDLLEARAKQNEIDWAEWERDGDWGWHEHAD